jgi:hypothetical protein
MALTSLCLLNETVLDHSSICCHRISGKETFTLAQLYFDFASLKSSLSAQDEFVCGFSPSITNQEP